MRYELRVLVGILRAHRWSLKLYPAMAGTVYLRFFVTRLTNYCSFFTQDEQVIDDDIYLSHLKIRSISSKSLIFLNFKLCSSKYRLILSAINLAELNSKLLEK